MPDSAMDQNVTASTAEILQRIDAVAPIISVDDGDWHNRTVLPSGLLGCLEDADSENVGLMVVNHTTTHDQCGECALGLCCHPGLQR